MIHYRYILVNERVQDERNQFLQINAWFQFVSKLNVELAYTACKIMILAEISLGTPLYVHVFHYFLNFG